ncbi:MAG: MFS transporter [Acidobacteria bacterium 13_2_20CM_2_66_4]|nr:MAG: MFS transporter [Acidobacteria bacterium 13_2_20CM_2_66_4]
MTRAQRTNQRNAVLAGFLGWTLDALDFFLLTLVIDDVAKSFGRTRPDIAFTLTVTLAMRPLGAIIFGIMADRLGRRLPLMINVIFYAVISVLSGLAPSYQVFLLLRMLFGVGMGGEWGVGASLALESASPRLRGLLSGLLQEGYALGNLLSAIAFRLVYPWFNAMYPGDGWRLMFFLGGLPALLSLFIRARVKESDAWHEHKTDWATYRKSLPNYWRRFAYLVVLMTMMNFMSHGTQDMYPTMLGTLGYTKARIADVTMLSGIGAILGGLAFGYYSDRSGRRRAMLSAIVCALIVVPFWIAGHSPWRILIGVFLMQFFVQGAWGVIPAHINELSPNHLRGFFPGFAYQLGVMFAASIPYVESALGERFTYTQAMGGLVTVVFIVGFIVTASGPEAKGVSFRKAVH